MQAGDVVFFYPSDWIGRLIAKIDGGEFSHVAMAVSDSHIIEAQYFTKSRIAPIYSKNVFILDLNLSKAERDQITANAIAITGRWYDYKLIVGYFFRNVFSWNFKKLWNAKNNLICSELVSMLLASIGYQLQKPCEKHNISPRELYDCLSQA